MACDTKESAAIWLFYILIENPPGQQFTSVPVCQLECCTARREIYNMLRSRQLFIGSICNQRHHHQGQHGHDGIQVGYL